MPDEPPIFFFDVDEVIAIQQNQIDLHGGEPGIHSRSLLESAVGMPRQGFFGEYANEFPFGMAAAYLYHLARNHAFVDGNKRVGAATAVNFLKVHGLELDATTDQLVELTISVATGKIEKAGVAQFLKSHTS